MAFMGLEKGGFFGNLFKKADTQELENKVQTNQIATEDNDGAVVVKGAYDEINYALDFLQCENQAQLIDRYREIANFPIVDYAIEDIVNECVSFTDDENAIELDLSGIDEKLLTEAARKKIYQAWDKICDLMDMNDTIHKRMRRFYIDGRLAYQKVVSPNKLSEGIKKIIELDSRSVILVRQVEYDEQRKIIKGVKESFFYDENVRTAGSETLGTKSQVRSPQSQLVLDRNSIAYTTSGLTDTTTGYTIGWLHKAITPANLQRLMENSLVVYRITRAPERRIFYVDVSGVPTSKAAGYLQNLKNNYRNQMAMDPTSGKFKDQRHLMTMQEDYWLPRNSQGKGTEVTTLPGGQNLSEIEDVLYFQKQLYRALNVPLSRMEPDSSINFGRTSEITRDELKFSKFVSSIRKRFNIALKDLLKTELTLTNVLKIEEWEQIQNKIKFKYSQDAYIEESKKADLFASRVGMLEQIQTFVGTYFSEAFVRREVLKQTEEEINQIKEEIEKEKKELDDKLETMKKMNAAIDGDDPNPSDPEEVGDFDELEGDGSPPNPKPNK